jgi:hypothetical protein
MGIIEKIKEIEFEMARTQKNKATGSYSAILQHFNCGISVRNKVRIFRSV